MIHSQAHRRQPGPSPRSGFLLHVAFILCLVYGSALSAQPAKRLSTMPRVDVHTHLGSLKEIDAMLHEADILKEQHQINLAVWINLQPFLPVGAPPPLTPESFTTVEQKYQGRILSCIGDYNVPGGLQYTPDEMAAWQKRGIVGYKIWYPVVIGPYPPAKDIFTIYAPGLHGIDALANEPVFAAMERLGLPGACIHIGQPHPRRWKNPVHFWTAIQSWLRVMDRHPRMVVVMAHMMNLFHSDEQLDFLSYVLETYPNLHVELGGRFGDFPAMPRDHLRDFMIRYSNRILFGTDVSGPSIWRAPEQQTAAGYVRAFKLLESEELVPGGFFNEKGPSYRGLGLPVDVLEKIYYKNAMRIFPRLKSVLQQLGYPVE